MIFKRNRIYYFEFTRHGKRYRGSTKTGNKNEALRIEAEHRANGTASRRSEVKLDFGDCFASFLVGSGSQVKPRTLQRYKVSGKRLGTHFGSLRLGDVTGSEIERFKSKRMGECSKAGTNRDLACLRAFLNWCQRTNLLDKAPYIRLLPEDSHIIRPITFEEVRGYL